MTTFFYTTKVGGSKQSWLGNVLLCPHCNSQQPKDGFKLINSEQICQSCQEELVVP